MRNTIAKDTLREYVMRNEVVLAKGDKVMIKKGDTFVKYQPRQTMIFMKVNDVEHTDSMDFCTVTWHMLDAKGLNVQSRFPMAHPMACFLVSPQLNVRYTRMLLHLCVTAMLR